ncbi:MAG: dockerin type I domain-containing protein [Pirellulaceae bacterium]|nr:dockerin type I domain-containing protein [Pirellulaceae bacterium]
MHHQRHARRFRTPDVSLVPQDRIRRLLMEHLEDRRLLSDVPGSILQVFHPPEAGYRFGAPVVPFGGQVLVGDYWIDEAYVYDATDGSKLYTFSNPSPITSGYTDAFGYSMAAVGSNKVIVGAHGDDDSGWEAGAAYLYTYDGSTWTLQRSWNGTSSDSFGEAVAAYGNDVLIGAPANDSVGDNAGAVYLYDSSTGNRLQTFSGEATGDHFSYAALAASGNSLAIGAQFNDTGARDAGAVYVYTQDGSNWQRQKISNPTPAADDRFGSSVAWLGDTLLVGCQGAGEVYLYDGSGTILLLTIRNPNGQGGQHGFGMRVAAVGNNILVSHPSFNSNSGIVYLFDGSQRGVYTGDPLLTISNPDPSTLWTFGHNIAAMGNNILVGAPQTPNGGYGGRAYLFKGPTAHTEAPYVVSATPAGRRGEAVSTVQLIFDQPMDTSVNPLAEQVVSAVGPWGRFALQTCTWRSTTILELGFETQNAPGMYSFVLEPSISSAIGLNLDQDRDGNAGEPIDDVFRHSFEIFRPSLDQLPDLSIDADSVVLSPSGSQQRITATVRNVGGTTATNIAVLFRDLTSGRNIGTQTISSLIANASVDVTMLWTPGAQPATLEVVVDPFDQIREQFNDNNQARVAYSPPSAGSAPTVRNVRATLDANVSPTIFGQFIAGIHGVWNRFSAEVTDADGAANIARVQFSLGSLPLVVDNSSSDGWTAEFDMGRLAGDAQLTVTAYDKQGNTSTEWRGNVKVIPLPSWVDPASSRFVRHTSLYYDLAGWRPRDARMEIPAPPSWIPLIGGRQSVFQVGLLTQCVAGLDGKVVPDKSRTYTLYEFKPFGKDMTLFSGGLRFRETPLWMKPSYVAFDLNLPGLRPVFDDRLEVRTQQLVVSGELRFDYEAFSAVNSITKLWESYSGKDAAWIFGGRFPLTIFGWPISLEAALLARVGASFQFTVDWPARGGPSLVPVSYVQPRFAPALKLKANIFDIGVARLGVYLLGSFGMNMRFGQWDSDPQLDIDRFIDMSADLGAELIVGPWVAKLGQLRWWDWSSNSAAGEWPGGGSGGDSESPYFRLLESADVVTMPDGRILVAYVAPSEDGWSSDVVYCIRDNGGTWSGSLPLSGDEGRIDLAPSLTVRDNGTAIAVWTRIILSREEVASATAQEVLAAQEIMWAQFDGAVWSEAMSITQNSDPDGNAVTSFSANGSGLTVFVTNGSGDFRDLASNEVMYSFFDGMTWQEPKPVTSNAADDRSVDIAFITDTHAVATWLQGAESASILSTPYFSVWNGLHWTPPEALPGVSPGDMRAPQVATLSDGRCLIVWAVVDSSTTILRSLVREADGTWAEDDAVAIDLTLVDGLQLEVNDEDTAFAVFRGYGSSEEIVVVSRAFGEEGSKWTTMAPVSQSDAIEWMPAATVTPNGDLFVVFAEGMLADGSIPPADGSVNPIKHATVYQGPDLTFLSDSLVLAQADARAGQPNALVARVANWGHRSSGNFEVSFYDGNPAEGGTLIGAPVELATLSPDGEFTVTSDSFVLTSGTHEFYAIVQPVAGESILDNNSMRLELDVLPPDVTGPRVSLAIPEIGKFREGDGTLTVLFDEAVTYVADSDVSLVEDEWGIVPPDHVYLSPDGLSATLIFEGGLRRGHYTLRVFDSITDLVDNRLDGDGDGDPTGDYATRFSIVPGLTYFAATGLITAESGSEITFHVVLDTQPSTDVIVAFVSRNPTEGVVVSGGLQFGPENWNEPQTVTVRGVDDWKADGDTVYHVVAQPLMTDDPDYQRVAGSDVEIVNTDDDVASVAVSPESGRLIAVNSTSGFTLRLTSQPTANVNITFTAEPASGVVTPLHVTFDADNWGTPQTVTVDSLLGSGPRDFQVSATIQSDDGDYARTMDDLLLVDLFPWHNPDQPLDTNKDGSISPIDALVIINYLNTAPENRVAKVGHFLDVNRDEYVSPRDALVVINHLNQGGGGEEAGESEASTASRAFWLAASGAPTGALAASRRDSSGLQHAPEKTACACDEDAARANVWRASLDLLFAKFDAARVARADTTSAGFPDAAEEELTQWLEEILSADADRLAAGTGSKAP